MMGDTTVKGVLSLSAGVAVFTLQDTILKYVSGGYPLTEAMALRGLVALPLLTFIIWRGEGLGRSSDLGEAMGAFLRELLARLDDPQRLRWLQDDFHLDAASARNLVQHVTRQVVAAGCV